MENITLSLTSDLQNLIKHHGLSTVSNNLLSLAIREDVADFYTYQVLLHLQRCATKNNLSLATLHTQDDDLSFSRVFKLSDEECSDLFRHTRFHINVHSKFLIESGVGAYPSLSNSLKGSQSCLDDLQEKCNFMSINSIFDVYKFFTYRYWVIKRKRKTFEELTKQLERLEYEVQLFSESRSSPSVTYDKLFKKLDLLKNEVCKCQFIF